MTAQCFRLLSTSKPVAAYQRRRVWVDDRRPVELALGAMFQPFFSDTGDGYRLYVNIRTSKKAMQIEPSQDAWTDLEHELGMKILPLAVQFDDARKPCAVLIDFAIINPCHEFII